MCILCEILQQLLGCKELTLVVNIWYDHDVGLIREIMVIILNIYEEGIHSWLDTNVIKSLVCQQYFLCGKSFIPVVPLYEVFELHLECGMPFIWFIFFSSD